MRRLLVFPPFFAIWFLAAQFGLAVINSLSLWLVLRLVIKSVPFYLPSLSNWSSPYFLKESATGAVFGLIFALLDCHFQPKSASAEETIIQLLPNLLKSGAITVAVVLLYYGAIHIPLQLQIVHTPTYTPYRTIFSWSYFVPHTLLSVALLWSIKKTLQTQTRQENTN